QAPAHVGATNPARERGQIGFVEAKAATQRRHVEQVQHVAGGNARVGQGQQQFQPLHQRVGGAAALVGQAIRDAACVVPVVQAEHGAYVRGVGVDVRHHHDDVARAQGGVGVEGGEQPV